MRLAQLTDFDGKVHAVRAFSYHSETLERPTVCGRSIVSRGYISDAGIKVTPWWCTFSGHPSKVTCHNCKRILARASTQLEGPSVTGPQSRG